MKNLEKHIKESLNHSPQIIKTKSIGTNKYELLFPRGSVNLKESIIDAANRELKEEIGLGANKLTFI